MSDKPLTRRQSEALLFIKSFIDKNGYPPTIRELADHMKYQSSSTAFNIMEQLVRKGYVKKNGNGPRMIKIISNIVVSDPQEEIEEIELLRTENECLRQENTHLKKALALVMPYLPGKGEVPNEVIISSNEGVLDEEKSEIISRTIESAFKDDDVYDDFEDDI